MFANIVLSFKTLNTHSSEALYIKVMSLRDIKDGIHVRMRNRFLTNVKDFVSKHKKRLTQAVNITFTIGGRTILFGEIKN